MIVRVGFCSEFTLMFTLRVGCCLEIRQSVVQTIVDIRHLTSSMSNLLAPHSRSVLPLVIHRSSIHCLWFIFKLLMEHACTTRGLSIPGGFARMVDADFGLFGHRAIGHY